MGRQIDGQTDRRTGIQTDGQTNVGNKIKLINLEAGNSVQPFQFHSQKKQPARQAGKQTDNRQTEV